MESKAVLLDLFADNNRRVHQLLDDSPLECLYWQPDPGANNIAVTIWHATRVFDVFKTRHIDDLAGEMEIWKRSGWIEKTGYDPYGLGTNGWGTIQGYSMEEVAEIPPMSKAHLGGYYDEVVGVLQAYLEETPEEELGQFAPGFEGKQTNFFWVKHPLYDLTRHVGEMLAIKAQWERQAGPA